MTDDAKPEKFDLSSLDIAAQKRADLLRLFPETRTEGGKIDFERLKAVLGETVDSGRERYGLVWPGKADCLKTIQMPSLGTLRPKPEESVSFDTTGNVIIEGDNLEVLKLMQKSYLAAVDMIFIDPPYNTGQDFIYPDNFGETLQTYLEYTGQVDASGRKFATNFETDGRYHSKWLNMMYPRLYLARNLMKDEGVIFITIGDDECDNLSKLCAEIFGEENFVAHIVWQKKYAVSQDDPGIASMHDHILVYAKSDKFRRRLLPRTEKQIQRYTNPDNDPRGPWSSDNYISNNSREERPTLWYPIIHPRTGEEVWPKETAVWRYSREKHAEMEREGRLYWGPDQSYERPRLKRFLSEVQDGVVPSTWWPFEEVGHNDEGQKETAELIGPKIFTTPKPVRLIRRMLDVAAGPDALVMDFFAGAGTTAHAVLAANDADGGKRRFILVQLPEPTRTPNKEGSWDESPAWKAGYKTIADITKERVRQAGIRLAEAKKAELDLNGGGDADYGFRVFRLADSNLIPWDATASKNDDDLGKQLELHVDHVKDGRSDTDILYEILLKSGFSLTTSVEEKALAGLQVFSVGGDVLLICLERKLTLELIRAMADLKPERVVCLDEGFAGNDQLKANAVQTFRTKGVASFRTV